MGKVNWSSAMEVIMLANFWKMKYVATGSTTGTMVRYIRENGDAAR